MIYEEDVEKKKTKTICYSILFYFTHSFWLKKQKKIYSISVMMLHDMKNISLGAVE